MWLVTDFFSIFLACLLLLPTLQAEVSLPTGISGERLAMEILWRPVSSMSPQDRPRIILVLGGGGARGLSHIGVLRVLEEENIPVDEIVGVSVGSLIGSLYAAGIPIRKIESMAHDIGWDNLTDITKASMVKLILSEDLLSTEGMEKYLRLHMDDKSFSDLKIPFVCVATDLKTGERVVFSEGPLITPVRASATIPAIFKPVEYRQRSLVDGGLVSNLPTDIPVRRKAWDLIIAVSPMAEVKNGETNSVFKSLVRVIDIQKDFISQEQKKLADLLIEPKVGNVSMLDLNRSRELIEAGTIAARESACEIKTLVLKRIYDQGRGVPEVAGR